MSEQAGEDGRRGFQFEGVKYEMTSLMLAEARAIQRATGYTPVQWETKINEGDAEALTALFWIARKRNGEPNLRFEDVDGDLGTFLPYLDEPEDPETDVEPGKAADGSNVPETSAGPSSAAVSTASTSTTPPESGGSTESDSSTRNG